MFACSFLLFLGIRAERPDAVPVSKRFKVASLSNIAPRRGRGCSKHRRPREIIEEVGETEDVPKTNKQIYASRLNWVVLWRKVNVDKGRDLTNLRDRIVSSNALEITIVDLRNGKWSYGDEI